MQFKPFHYAIAAAIAGGIYWFYPSSESESTGVAGYQTKPITVGKIESLVNSAGTLSPVVTVEVGTEISGLVQELHADFNSEVTAGQVIARIDDQTVQAQLRQNEANLISAQANLEQQNANLKKAEADLKLNLSSYNRQKDLYAKGLTSISDLEAAEASYINADAQIALVKAQVSSAKANILQSEAQLEQSKVNLERTYIRSPVNGTVIDRQVDVGQTVAASLSAPTLFQIAQDLTKMQIEADVDEADIGQINEGQNVRFTVDAFPDSEFSGEVTQVRKASTITSNVVTYKVIIGANNPRQQLLPGMTANVDIILGEKDDVLRVENSALRFNPPGAEETENNGDRNNDASAEITAKMDEMGLSGSQKNAVNEAVDEMRASITSAREAGTGGFGAPSAQELISQARTRLTNKLSSALTDAQITELSSVLPGGGRGNREGGGRRGEGGQRTTTGQVWILQDGNPVAMRVRVGLSDDQYSEIISDELNEGDEVILRALRAAQ